MSRSEPAGLESRHDDSTVRRGLLGLDAEGGVHEIDPATRTVTVRSHDGIEHVEQLGDALGDALDREVPADLNRSDLLRLLLRAGLATSAPDHLDAIREAVREQAVEPL